ncbi:MAG: hypothetical protein MIO92_00215 [Methanosarcinaceae archaeon]|nr:hypothetical protein [Methanosarcinaceae archaeon]
MKVRIYKLGYEHYKKVQTEANHKKINNVWVEERTIAMIKNYIGEASKILCHGTRSGREQQYFKKYFIKCDIIGTEISDTAKNYPDTIEWDFHEVKPEWENHFDLIYSNSLDHSYNPYLALKAWLSCLNDSGTLVIEWTGQNERSTWNDPFSATLEELKGVITNKKVGGKIIHIGDIPTDSAKRKYQKLLYIRNN